MYRERYFNFLYIIKVEPFEELMPFYGLDVIRGPWGPTSQPFLWLDQVLRFRGHILRESHFTLKNQLEGLVVCLSLEGYLSRNHLEYYASQGPDITRGARDVIVEHLRAHIERSPNEGPFPLLYLRFFLLLIPILL